jgi:hypothetical protein
MRLAAFETRDASQQLDKLCAAVITAGRRSLRPLGTTWRTGRLRAVARVALDCLGRAWVGRFAFVFVFVFGVPIGPFLLVLGSPMGAGRIAFGL